MKKLIYLIVAVISAQYVSAQSQDYTHDLSGIKKVSIITNTDVEVKAANSGKLIIRNAKKKIDQKAKGLKAVYAKGVDNTNGLGFSIKKEGDVLVIHDLKSHFKRDDLHFVIPSNIDLKINTGSLGDLKVSGFKSELELRTTTGDIRLENITGPVTVNSSTGEVNVVFATVNQSSPISINSSTGDVDVSLPTNTKADLSLRTSMGTVYTDFDLSKPKKDAMKVAGATRKITHQLNNGGVNIRLRSSTGNVYLRKK